MNEQDKDSYILVAASEYNLHIHGQKQWDWKYADIPLGFTVVPRTYVNCLVSHWIDSRGIKWEIIMQRAQD